MDQFPVSLFAEFVSFLCCAVFFFIKRDRLTSLFFPFLFLTVCIEFVGWATRTSNWSFKFGAYNIFYVIEFIFYTIVFYIHFTKKAFRTIALVFMPLFIVFCLINMLFVQGLNKTFNSYSSLAGSFFIVLFCCFFFYESILPDQIDRQLAKQPLFWISSGLLIFYLGSVIINALFDYLTSNDLAEQGKRIYRIILHSLNVLLYGSFCIAFYLCPNARKASLPQSQES